MITEELSQLIYDHIRRDPFAAPELRVAMELGHFAHHEVCNAEDLEKKDIWNWTLGGSNPVRHEVRVGLGKDRWGGRVDCLYNGIVYRVHGIGIEHILGRIGDGTWYDSEEPPTERKATEQAPTAP